MNIKDLVVKIIVKKSQYNLNLPTNESKVTMSSGTGFFIKQNFILTCYHVIENHVKIKVRCRKDKKEFVASVHSIYPDDDLAILFLNENIVNIEGEVPIRVLNKKDSDEQEVVAYGYPLDSNNLKMSKGIISGYQDSLIQTDATLNPGNSGGPLILKEKIIGVNAIKITSEKVDNVGYSIPIQRFLVYAISNINNKSKLNLKPRLEIKVQIIKDENQFKKFEIPEEGVRVLDLINTSEFYKSGIRKGDFILKFDNKNVDIFGDIEIPNFPEKIKIDEISKWYAVGQEVDVEYFSVQERQIIKKKITLSESTLVYPDIYKNYKDSFFAEISDLIISVISKKHFENIEEININPNDKIYILNSFLNMDNKFIIYLSYQKQNKDSIELPRGSVIKKINDKEINSYEELISIKEIDSIEFLHGQKYYLTKSTK